MTLDTKLCHRENPRPQVGGLDAKLCHRRFQLQLAVAGCCKPEEVAATINFSCASPLVDCCCLLLTNMRYLNKISTFYAQIIEEYVKKVIYIFFTTFLLVK